MAIFLLAPEKQTGQINLTFLPVTLKKSYELQDFLIIFYHHSFLSLHFNVSDADSEFLACAS